MEISMDFFLPSTFLIEDKLELVFRYQWAQSEDCSCDRVVGTACHRGRRYDGVIVARGDDNHSFYGGFELLPLRRQSEGYVWSRV